ncbi:hypothetical protein A7A08_02283 [Methyloligella halotolerans]|uniref:Glutamine amidotransferase domain-containing protein n=2 Tax=Methyloligella halotolerans TaxID=1177755 RepID=A0A1E2RXL7_9HYPH|nr:hypothetical protein [Methyloligella halotolerans]ODA66986.1 hypothetical protein A7A08_02283 [Methyloligella halotolerans]
MSWSIEFLPLVSWPILGGLAAIGALLLLLLLWRSRRGALLRGTAYALLLLALANPHFKKEEREPLNDVVAVVVDDSQSQAVAGRTTRTAELQQELEKRLRELPNLDLRVIHSSSAADNPDRDGSFLFTDLAKGLADTPPERLAGVVMLTDGQVHDVPKTAAELNIDAPIHAIVPGKKNEFDRRLKLLAAPRFGLVGESQTVELQVEETGGRPAKPIALTIKRQGEDPLTETVTPGEKVSIPVMIDHAGANIVEIAAEVDPEELTGLNNRTVLTIEGVRENLRVLLVSGEPYAGERTWRNMLKSDASVDLVHFTILRPPEKQDGTPINQLSLIAFPTRELFQEKLEEFDLIIFDRYQRRGVLPLAYLDNVSRYVLRGGAVLVAAGEDYASPLSLFRTPLAYVLPAEPTGRVINEPFKPKPTDLGERHPVTRDLPGGGEKPRWGSWFRNVEATPNDAEIVMEGAEGNPLLVLAERGEGRVALLLSDQAWLWARGYEGGGPYTGLLRRLAHWLMKEPELEEEQLHASSRGQTITIERQTIKDEVEPVSLSGPTGDTRSVTLKESEPGVWRAQVNVSEQGIYQVSAGELASVVTVGNANTRELAAVTASDEALKPVLDETGGGSYWLGRKDGEADEMPRIVMLGSSKMMHGDDWLGLHRRDAYRVTGASLYPLFNGYVALALLLGLMALAWYREGR